MEYHRQIEIDVSLKKTHHFMREVKNLPVWTRFFKHCISYNGTDGEMETALGKSLTSIQEKQTKDSIELLICSKFDQRQEQALVTIEGDQKQSRVTFYLKVPPHIHEQQQKKMVVNLEEELRILKAHLESSYG